MTNETYGSMDAGDAYLESTFKQDLQGKTEHGGLDLSFCKNCDYIVDLNEFISSECSPENSWSHGVSCDKTS